MMAYDEYAVRNGKIGVAYSGSHGLGWASVVPHEMREWATMHVLIIELALSRRFDDIFDLAKSKAISLGHTNLFAYKYTPYLTVDWIPLGSRWMVYEYDGLESILTDEDIDWVYTPEFQDGAYER